MRSEKVYYIRGEIMKKENTNIVENLFEGVYYVDRDRTITSWNKGAVEITGFESNEVMHRKCYSNILNHIDENGVALCFDGCPLHATLEDGNIREAKVFLQHKNGHRVPVKVKVLPIYNNDEQIQGAVEIFTEIKNENYFQSEMLKLQSEVYNDALTSVPNRKYLNAILESKIREYKKINRSFGVSFIDIDNFKQINDTFGHLIGDEILKLLASTIKSNIRSNDIVGRLGGEEFVIIFTDVDFEILYKVSEKIRRLVEGSKLRLDSRDLGITISIGSTLVLPNDSVESILNRADELMYESKRNGKNRVTQR